MKCNLNTLSQDRE